MKYYVYILQSSQDGRYYIGKSCHLTRRITEHYIGKTKSIKYRMPLILVHTEWYSSNLVATQREAYIKRLKGGSEFKRIIFNRIINVQSHKEM